MSDQISLERCPENWGRIKQTQLETARKMREQGISIEIIATITGVKL
jgi:hypothetical protein